MTWEVDIRQYFFCLVAVQVSLAVFLVDVDDNLRTYPRKFEKYDGDAGSEDVVIICKVVLYTNNKILTRSYIVSIYSTNNSQKENTKLYIRVA